jgi:PadR family transcriptional regulator PadR
MAFSVSAGLLDAMVLAIVSKEETYGYKITQDIREAMDISESTLYPVLRRLQKDDCLITYDQAFMGRNRRYYKVTQKGVMALGLYKEEWKLYKSRIDKILVSEGEI